MFLVAIKLSQQLLARLLILGSLLRLLLSFLHQLLEDSHRVCLLHRIRGKAVLTLTMRLV